MGITFNVRVAISSSNAVPMVFGCRALPQITVRFMFFISSFGDFLLKCLLGSGEGVAGVGIRLYPQALEIAGSKPTRRTGIFVS